MGMTEAPSDPVEVRRMRASEWRSLRSLRLEALLDSPLAYGSTHEREVRRPDAHLIAVYVAPDWRGRGIGRAVSEAVVAWARERGARAVILSVSDWNDTARRVYESIGFVPTGVQKSLPWNASVTESEMRLELA